MAMQSSVYWKPALGVAGLLAIVLIYWLAREFGLLAILLDGEQLKLWMLELGIWGPAAVVGLMTVAILVSPIPSAPIAIAAGAVYGHFWGTIYVLVGAEAGAVGAFFVARIAGRELIYRWFGDRISRGWLGSQLTLMLLVFISRLLPFLSFDLISYAAGLTALSFWRFAVATLAGILPASFLLAHFGNEMASGEGKRIMTSVIALGAITLVPFIGKILHDQFRKRPRQ